MASTYTLISSNTLSGSTASVTFSSIPQTYTDLVLRYSARDTFNATGRFTIQVTTNGGGQYSYTSLIGDSSAASSSRSGAGGDFRAGAYSTGAATANTFGNGEIYIPNYTLSARKPVSNFGVAENNSATQGDTYIEIDAGNFTFTGAITSITLGAYSTFASGSSFYLYGIKNS